MNAQEESSTLASIILSSGQDVAQGPHKALIQKLLEEITTKALDPSRILSKSRDDTLVPAMQTPKYERFAIVGYADGKFL